MKKESPFPAKGMELAKTAAILSLREKHCKEVNSQCYFLEKYMENSTLSLVLQSSDGRCMVLMLGNGPFKDESRSKPA